MVLVACSVGVPVRVEPGLRTRWNGISAISLVTGDSGLLKVGIVDSDSDSRFGILARKPYVIRCVSCGKASVGFASAWKQLTPWSPSRCRACPVQGASCGRTFPCKTCFAQDFFCLQIRYDSQALFFLVCALFEEKANSLRRCRRSRRFPPWNTYWRHQRRALPVSHRMAQLKGLTVHDRWCWVSTGLQLCIHSFDVIFYILH